jgi:hypothetical protein
MACPTLIDPACVIHSVISQAAGTVTSGAMTGIAGAIQSGVAWLVSNTVDWWVKVPSPDLSAEPAVGALQRWLLPITVAVAVLAMLIAAGKIVLTRKANPLADVGSGLAIITATSAVGVLLPSLLLKAGDAWSTWVLAASTGGQFGPRLSTLLELSGATSGVVIVLGIVAMILTAIQAVLMLFRQAALIILAGVLPLAAAGTLTPATRTWFRRVTGWMLALIFYKPAAAAVYATAFTMIGSGRDPRTILMGFAMVLLSLLALPALMKFFTWTTGGIDGPAGGGFLGTVVSGAIAVGAVRASTGGLGGSSAVDQARLVSAQLGPQGVAGIPGAVGPQGAGTSGAGPGPAPGGVTPAAGSGAGPAGARSAGTATATGSAGAGSAAREAGLGSAGGGVGAAGGAGAAGAAAGPAGAVGAAAVIAAEGAVNAGGQAADAMQPPRVED